MSSKQTMAAIRYADAYLHPKSLDWILICKRNGFSKSSAVSWVEDRVRDLYVDRWHDMVERFPMFEDLVPHPMDMGIDFHAVAEHLLSDYRAPTSSASGRGSSTARRPSGAKAGKDIGPLVDRYIDFIDRYDGEGWRFFNGMVNPSRSQIRSVLMDEVSTVGPGAIVDDLRAWLKASSPKDDGYAECKALIAGFGGTGSGKGSKSGAKKAATKTASKGRR